jgi:hypothetical protein
MPLPHREAERKIAAAARLNAERYQQRRHPDCRTPISLERRLRETGLTRPNMTNAGRLQSRRGAEVKDVLRAVDQPMVLVPEGSAFTTFPSERW